MVDVLKDKTSHMATHFSVAKNKSGGGSLDDFDRFAAIEGDIGSAMESIQMSPRKQGNTLG